MGRSPDRRPSFCLRGSGRNLEPHGRSRTRSWCAQSIGVHGSTTAGLRRLAHRPRLGRPVRRRHRPATTAALMVGPRDRCRKGSHRSAGLVAERGLLAAAVGRTPPHRTDVPPMGSSRNPARPFELRPALRTLTQSGPQPSLGFRHGTSGQGAGFVWLARGAAPGDGAPWCRFGRLCAASGRSGRHRRSAENRRRRDGPAGGANGVLGGAGRSAGSRGRAGPEQGVSRNRER